MLLSFASLRLASTGKLDLDAPICTYLPELTSGKARRIQVRHILSHTSGYQPFQVHREVGATYPGWDDFVELFLKTPMLFSPGTVFNYHSCDHRILERIVDQLTGCARTLVEEEILRPLGLAPILAHQERSRKTINVVGHTWNHTSLQFDPCDEGCDREDSVFDLRMSIPELLSLTRGLFSADEQHVLDGPAATIMQATFINIPCATQLLWQQDVPISYGYGLARYQDDSFGHPGSSAGQCCGIRFDVQRQFALAIGLNRHIPPIRDGLIELLTRIIASNAAASKSTSRMAANEFEKQEIVGSYISSAGGGELVVHEDANGLVLTMTAPKMIGGVECAFSLDPQRGFVPHAGSRMPPVPISFFFDPDTMMPCIMLGWCAFKKSGP